LRTRLEELKKTVLAEAVAAPNEDGADVIISYGGSRGPALSRERCSNMICEKLDPLFRKDMKTPTKTEERLRRICETTRRISKSLEVGDVLIWFLRKSNRSI